MRTRSQTGFAALQTEGAILPADLLRRISEGDSSLGGLDSASYHLPAGERLSEAVSRSWSRLQGSWAAFKSAKDRLPETDAGTTLTRERWLLPLFHELGYGRLTPAKPLAIGEKTYSISHGWHHTPLHLVSFRLDIDKRQPGMAGASKSSPHSLIQELLNRSEEHLWGFVSNGLGLRILRDNASLSRQAYVEFDLEAIFDGELYADFAILWLLCHESRVEAEEPASCWLERWSKAAKEQGTRALDRLRTGVEEAISALGAGFLVHPANARLRDRLQSGALPAQEYYRELLRHVYRLLFLFVAEDRNLLHVPGATTAARARFARFFSTQRLRQLALRTRGSRHGDLFCALRLMTGWLGSDVGRPEFGLPALGSLLFSESAVAETGECEIANRDLLLAVRALSFTVDGGIRRTVDYRNLGAEELGSVYESLLELHPRLDVGGGAFALDSAAGHERKTTGSYYTPDSLVKCLLDSALEPVIDEACKSTEPEAALLGLKICDPACGSGHFLIAAAHRIAHRLAFLRTGSIEPPPELVRIAFRDVVGRCLYGVDLNPMAVELCKVSLWMEALEPGRPLSFLDHHVRVGNSLLGTTPDLMASGIPDQAFDPMEGDDKALSRELKKRNKAERTSSQTSLLLQPGSPIVSQVRRGLQSLGVIEDTTLEGVRAREKSWRTLEESETMRGARLAADAWCAAFVWEKQPGRPLPLTSGQLATLQSDARGLSGDTRREIESLAAKYGFFHWHLVFPDVFDERQGFDVVLGNPPWDRVKLQEQEFFATRDEAAARAPNAAARKRLIAALPTSNPGLWAEWCAASREAEGQSQFIRRSGRYPLCGQGDVNTYALFAEHNRSITSPQGRAGFIVPGGIAADDTTKEYFQEVVSSANLAALYHFENEDKVFPGIHHATRFVLMTLDRSGCTDRADLVFYARQVADLDESERHFSLSPADFALFNPNTRTCPTFRSRCDAELNLALYRRAGVLWREGDSDGNPWGLRFMAMFHMANDSGLFRTRGDLEARGNALDGNRFDGPDGLHLPLLEAKMVHHFDHRFGTYEGQTEAQANQGKLPELDDRAHADPKKVTYPAYWVAAGEVEERLRDRWSRGWLLGWRKITGTEKQRTLVASLTPRMAAGDSWNVLFPDVSPQLAACLYGNLCSLVVDYAARQKVGGTNLVYHTFKQFPVISPAGFGREYPWLGGSKLSDWLLPRVLELSYTGWDISAFAGDLGHNGSPFRWNPDRRFLLRCEVDAAFLHAYLWADTSGNWRTAQAESEEDLVRLKRSFPSPRDAVSHILDTFPVVRKNDEKTYGEYRTKRVILEIFDAMTEAMSTGRPYMTRLDPPPADPRIAHSASRPT